MFAVLGCVKMCPISRSTRYTFGSRPSTRITSTAGWEDRITNGRTPNLGGEGCAVCRSRVHSKVCRSLDGGCWSTGHSHQMGHLRIPSTLISHTLVGCCNKKHILVEAIAISLEAITTKEAMKLLGWRWFLWSSLPATDGITSTGPDCGPRSSLSSDPIDTLGAETQWTEPPRPKKRCNLSTGRSMF